MTGAQHRFALVLGLPALLAAALGLIALGSPSYGTDEAATVSAAKRPLPDLWALVQHMDAVHGLYYLVLHPIVAMAGISESATRGLSVGCIALATLGVSVIGRQLASVGLGLMAGFVFALLPITSHYSMEARSGALTCALACWATVVLVALIQGGGRHHRALWVVYTLLMILAIAVFAFTALVLIAHVVTVLILSRANQGSQISYLQVGDAVSEPAKGGRQEFRSQLRLMPAMLWCLLVMAMVLLPLAIAMSRQTEQDSWIGHLSIHEVLASTQSWVVPHIEQPAFINATSWPLVLLLFAIAFFGIVSVLRGRSCANASLPSTRILIVVLPWLLIPISTLMAVSLLHPVFTERYVFPSTPAFALLVAFGFSAAPRVWQRVTLVVLTIALVVPVLILDRQPDAKGDLRALAQVIAANRRPGDALLFEPRQTARMVDAYPDAFIGMTDIGITSSAAASGTLSGLAASPNQVAKLLGPIDRLWVIAGDPSTPRYQALSTQLTQHGFSVMEQWKMQEDIQLWQRPSAP